MNKKNKLVRGSIRVVKSDIFYNDKETRYTNLTYGDLSAILNIVLPKEVKNIFDAAHITYNIEIRNTKNLKKVIKGLNSDDIKNEDDEHLRIHFSGLTESELRNNLQKAEKWLIECGVEYGEDDGKTACIFKCLTSKQLEIEEFK